MTAPTLLRAARLSTGRCFARQTSCGISHRACLDATRARTVLRPLALFVSVALSGCAAVGPDYAPPAAAVPAQFVQATTTTATAPAAWRWLDDATLRRLVDQGLARNNDVAVMQARLARARAVAGMQAAASGPALNVGVRVADDRLSQNGEMFANVPSRNVVTQFTNRNLAFDASWEIDLFGHQQRLNESAQARAASAAERLQDVRLMVGAEIARQYIELRLAQARLVNARERLALEQQRGRIVRAAVRAGELAALDERRALVGEEGAAVAIGRIESQLAQLTQALVVLTATPTEELTTLLGTADLPAVPAAPAAGLPSELLQRRPDVRAAERDLAAATADVGVSTAALYPRFSLLGTAGWNSVQAGNWLDRASQTWSLVPQLTLPIFNGGRLRQQVQVNEADAQAALASYRKTVLAAVADVDANLQRLARSEEARVHQGSALSAAQTQWQHTQRQQRAGEVAVTPVIDARLALVAQREQAQAQQAESLTALLALHKALGGAMGAGL